MALSERKRLEIVAEYKTGKYSQRELSKRHNVSVGTINGITKDLVKENEHLVNAQISLMTAKAHLSELDMNTILNTASEIVFNTGLITNATQLNLVRMTEHLKDNKKLEKVNVGDGIQHFEEVGLGSSDYKNIQDAIDKASITLGINQRHAKTEINNTNAQQVNTQYVGLRRITPEEREKALTENGRNPTP